MMRITKKKAKEAGSCNFCQRGKVNEDTFSGLIYPYKYVYEIKGNASVIRFCAKCLMELKHTNIGDL